MRCFVPQKSDIKPQVARQRMQSLMCGFTSWPSFSEQHACKETHGSMPEDERQGEDILVMSEWPTWAERL